MTTLRRLLFAGLGLVLFAVPVRAEVNVEALAGFRGDVAFYEVTDRYDSGCALGVEDEGPCLAHYLNVAAATIASAGTAAALATCIFQFPPPASLLACILEDAAHTAALLWLASAQVALNACLNGGGDPPPPPPPED